MRVSKRELCDFFVNYHGFDEFFCDEPGVALERIFSRVRSVQYDPLNVIGRNAELVCFARNGRISRNDLDSALYKSRTLVDGWDKMMCIYPSAEFPKFKRVREQATNNYRTVMSWRGQNECHVYTDEIYKYIQSNGETLVTDIPSVKTNGGGWGSSRVANVCCEYLWNSGRIVVTNKKGVVKCFDVTERVLGDSADTDPFKSFDDFADWYVKRRISSVGAARQVNGGAWLGVFVEDGDFRKTVLNRLVEKGEIIAVTVDGVKGEYYINAGDERFFHDASDKRAVFVPPLDNLIWDRKTVKSVFDFDYSWEVYTPPTKRKYGYYVLPILIGSRFVGRIEPVLSKDKKVLSVKNVWFERDCKLSDDDISKIIAELERLASFLGAIADKSSEIIIRNAR